MINLRLTDDELMVIGWALQEFYRREEGKLSVLSRYPGSRNAQEEARDLGAKVLVTRKLLKVVERVQRASWDEQRARRKRLKLKQRWPWRPTLKHLEDQGLWSPRSERK